MTSINSKSGCPSKNIESLRRSLITILLKCDGSLIKTTCIWRKVIPPRLDLICVELRSHLGRVNSFIECREPSAPLMTKPPGILAPSPMDQRVPASPDWWPAHLNSHHQHFTPLHHFLKYCWRNCSNLFKANIKIQNQMYVARWQLN